MTITHTLRRCARLLIGTTLAVGITAVATGATVSAGDIPSVANLNIRYQMPNTVGQSAADALDPELFVSGSDISAGGMCTEDATATPDFDAFRKDLRCTVQAGQEHVIGVDVVPAGHYVSFVFCFEDQPNEAIDLPNATVTPAPFTTTNCEVFIDPIPKVYLDKVVAGGPAAPGDFTLEIYDDSGSLIDGTLTDPSASTCALFDLDDTRCAAVTLDPGDYRLGEVLPDYGYELSNVTCDTERPMEIFESPIGDFTHGEFSGDTLCTITNQYVTQTVTADIVVINDNGGTATGADFTIEVFDNTGTKVDEGTDPEPGTGNASAEFTLPIGDYTFGVTGPDGYTATAAVTVVDIVDTEIIGTGADFTLTANQTAAGVITVDDPVPATTTTTTTTTTTLPPTTTTIVVELPATGSNSQTPTLLIALALLGLGSAAIITTRRS